MLGIILTNYIPNLSISSGGGLHGEQADVLDWHIVVSEFELQSR